MIILSPVVPYFSQNRRCKPVCLQSHPDLLLLVFFGPQTLWWSIGIVPLATGLLGSCPVYSILGNNTCPTRARSELTESGRGLVVVVWRIIFPSASIHLTE